MKPTGKGLPAHVLGSWASPALGLAAIGLPLTIYLPNFYAADLGLDLSAVGLAFMVVRLLDIGLDPVLGVVMDRTRTRFGRFRPWLAAGAPVLMLSAAVLCFAQKGVGPGYLVLGLLLAYGGWSIAVLAQTAWGAGLSPDYNERSRVYGWWQACNLIGLLSILLLEYVVSRVHPGLTAGVRAMGLYLLLLIPLSTLPAVLFAPETTPSADARPARLSDWLSVMRSTAVRRILAADLLIGLAYGIYGSLFLFYFTKAKGFSQANANLGLLLYFLSGLGGALMWTALARRTSKHLALILSSLCSIAGLAVLNAIPGGDMRWGAVAAVVAGLPYAAANQLGRAMMADAGDEERLKTGADRTGLLYAAFASTAKIGAALAVGATFIGLDAAGFVAASDHNGPRAILGLRILFLVVPAVLFVLAALTLIRYPLTRRRHDEIRLALESNLPI